MNGQAHAPFQAKPHLRLWDAVSVIVGIVIGAGIYETPPAVFQNVSGPWIGLALWAVAGGLSLVGALCYAELASTYPHSGGEIIYLRRAYGPGIDFLFGWSQIAVLRSGNIAMMAYVFAEYAGRLWSLSEGSASLAACGSVALLTGLNLLGVTFGKATQNLLTAAKVLGLGGIVVAGFLLAEPPSPSPATHVANPSLAAALVGAFFTFGGWNDSAAVAAEVRDGSRNIPRALFLGTLLVTAIYLLINGSYLWSLGFEGVRQSQAVAAAVLERSVGPWGAKAISLLVMISALGGMNGMIYTGSRVNSVLGANYGLFAWLGRWHPRFGSPVWAMLAQSGVSLCLIAVLGTPWGHSAVDASLSRLGLASVSWQGRSGFGTLLDCTAPLFWLFFMLTSCSLFVLRFRDNGRARPFSVPCYPLFPLLFCGFCGYMVVGAFLNAKKLALIGGLLALPGVPLYFLSQRRRARRTD